MVCLLHKWLQGESLPPEHQEIGLGPRRGGVGEGEAYSIFPDSAVFKVVPPAKGLFFVHPTLLYFVLTVSSQVKSLTCPSQVSKPLTANCR